MVIVSRKNIRYCISYILLISLPFILIPEVAWMATQQPQQGEQLLEEGIQAFKDGDFDIALANLEKAVVLLQDKEKLADAHFYLSLVYFAFRRIDKVKENLTEMFKLNPEAKPDMELCAPGFLALWEEVKKQAFAFLIIETNPDKAEVYLDDKFVGLTPLEQTEIVPGEHTLKVTKEGYQSKEESIILKAGGRKTISVNLENEVKKKKPIVAVTPPEKKPEVKKSKAWLWIVLGGAAAAAVALLAGGRSKDTGTAQTIPTQSTGPIKIRETGAGYNTIQAAINAATSGQHIDVPSGTYRENITINKGIHIVGENKNNTIINGAMGEYDVISFSSSANNASISKFNITNALWAAIKCSAVSVTIQNNIIKDNNSYAIECYNTSAIIKKNIMKNNGSGGIYLNNSSPEIIENIIIENKMSGIVCWYSSNPVIEGNSIKANDGEGIYIGLRGGISNPDIGGGGRSSGNNTIRNNRKSDIYNEGSNLIKAEKNCWDHNTEAEIERYDIEGKVDFIPFKTSCSSAHFYAIRFDISKIWLIIPPRVANNYRSFSLINFALIKRGRIIK